MAPVSRRRVSLCQAQKKTAGKMPAPQFAGRTIAESEGFFSRSKVRDLLLNAFGNDVTAGDFYVDRDGRAQAAALHDLAARPGVAVECAYF